jgi:hypothetical protein
MIYTCHTFGRDLGFKPHIHLVTTKGGLDKDEKWVEIDGIPGGKLSARWRYQLCKELRRLRPYDDALRMTVDDLYRRFRGFQVYTDSFYPRGLEAAKYIGRYLGHPPLATSHITQYDGQRLQFWYRETATGLRRDVSLSPLEFISRLVPHIPPQGMQLVRHAGLYARNVKAKWAEIAIAALEALRLQMPLFDLKPWATFFKTLTWRERITRACRQGR